MKKLIVLIIMVMAANAVQAVAQRREPSPEMQEKFFMAKMKAIQKELNLTEEQTNEFVPIYREYEEQMKQIYVSHAKENRGAKKDAVTMVNERIDVKIKVLELQKQYSEKFAKVLEPKQLLRLDRAEQKINFQIMNRHHNNGDKNRGNRYRRGNKAQQGEKNK